MFDSHTVPPLDSGVSKACSVLIQPTQRHLEESHTNLERNIFRSKDFKATNERLDWHNPKGKQYPFALRKPLLLIQDHQGHQVIPKDYFINNNLEYPKGPKRQRFYGFASKRTSSKDVYSRKRIIAVTRLKIMKWYDYDRLDEIQVRRDDQQLYTFKEGDLP
ncbi:hypothetical protein Tco_0901924 [Tanacetum coccineum]